MEMLIRRHEKISGNTTDINKLQTKITVLLIFLPIPVIVFRSNLDSKQHNKQETVAQTILK